MQLEAYSPEHWPVKPRGLRSARLWTYCAVQNTRSENLYSSTADTRLYAHVHAAMHNICSTADSRLGWEAPVFFLNFTWWMIPNRPGMAQTKIAANSAGSPLDEVWIYCIETSHDTSSFEYSTESNRTGWTWNSNPTFFATTAPDHKLQRRPSHPLMRKHHAEFEAWSELKL